jgi:hypothetical protein
MVQHLKETTGIHYDSTSNANDCPNVVVANQNAVGMIDGADEFDGNDDYVSKSGLLSGTLGTTYTISGWVKPDVVDGRLVELDNLILFFNPGPGPSGQTNYVSLYQYWSGHIGQWLPVQSNTITTSEGWMYISVTYEGGSPTSDPLIYKNGNLIAPLEEWNTPAGSFDTNYRDLYIGNREDLQRDFDGIIDEVRISNVVRSSGWIATEYNNQKQPSSFYNIGSEETPSIGTQEYTIPVHNYWNLISLPFNESRMNTNIMVRNNSIEYSWDDAVSEGIVLNSFYYWNTTTHAYGISSSLTPGKGYWMWAYYNCDLILTSAAEEDNNLSALQSGWNIMGLPLNTSLEKQYLIVRYNNIDYTWQQATTGLDPIILGFIYGWNCDDQRYTSSDTFDSSYGYWMYAYKDCLLKKGG